jgi:2-methylcitrate dehydratase
LASQRGPHYRRTFLHLAAGVAALPAVSRIARAQTTRPLAERLANYAYRLRYDDLDAATIEQVKLLVIDALGCGIAAFDEGPVSVVPSITTWCCGAANGRLVPGNGHRLAHVITLRRDQLGGKCHL